MNDVWKSSEEKAQKARFAVSSAGSRLMEDGSHFCSSYLRICQVGEPDYDSKDYMEKSSLVVSLSHPATASVT